MGNFLHQNENHMGHLCIAVTLSYKSGICGFHIAVENCPYLGLGSYAIVWNVGVNNMKNFVFKQYCSTAILPVNKYAILHIFVVVAKS